MTPIIENGAFIGCETVNKCALASANIKKFWMIMKGRIL